MSLTSTLSSSGDSISLPINFIPDNVILFFASTVTGLFLIYRAKVLKLLVDNKKVPRKEPYLRPTMTRRPSLPGPSIQRLTSFSSDPTLEGEVLEGYEINEIRVHKVDSLRQYFNSKNLSNLAHQKVSPVTGQPITYNCVLCEDDFILADVVRKLSDKRDSEAFVRAGPRPITHFDPKTVRAGIVTCGGLCPGLNNVIRELVHALVNLYNVEKIYGIKGGFNGMTDTSSGDYHVMELTEEMVADCHHQGGSILGSSRGGFDLDKMIIFLEKYQINQLYVIGGDGTHRGAQALANECLLRKLNISVAGIPKTIDNDVDLIDRSFGFQTSVEAAQAAIQSAKTEARCNIPNGVGIVKLMGRSAGFIAVHATLGSGDIDLCLVPEIPIVLEGDDGYLPFLLRRVVEKGHAVVVVAEGAGEELLGQSAEVDAGGNRKLPPIGEFMKEKIEKYFAKNGYPSTVKYINPSYMIRLPLSLSLSLPSHDSVPVLL
jgi:6-phosphofructokinase 1